MKRFPALFLAVGLAWTGLCSVGCSRDPNVRKQKYFASGQSYFEAGKYAEAAIQFSNATDIDPHFAAAHYQLALACLKLKDWNRAFQELSKTVALQPSNYAAHLELANLLIAARDFKHAQEQIDLVQSRRPDDPLLHLAIANLLAAQENFAGAIQEAQKAIELAPQRSESYLSLATLQLAAKQPEAAESTLKKAIAVDPKSANAHVALGTFYGSRNRYVEAEQQFLQAMQIDPQNPDPRAGIARLYLIQGKNAETETFLKQVKRDLPNNPEAYRMLGDFYYATGDLDKATEEYAALHHDHPQDLQVWKNYVQLLVLKNRLDEARRLDDEILKSYPGDSDALIYRGQIQTREGHANDAVTTLETVIKNDRQNALAHYHLGVALDQLGHLPQAQNEWQEAAQLRPDLLDVQESLASLALRTGDLGTLEQSASQIIKLRPSLVDGYVLRALSYTRRGDFAKAEQDARQAISVAPQSPAGYVQLGNLRLVQKAYGEAEKAYQQALDRDPRSADALGGLMTTYISERQADRAIAAANAQIGKAPDSSAFYDLLGTALFNEKKDLPGAEAAFSKAIALNKNNADALLKLGQVQVAKGSVAEAVATYQRSAQENPREINFEILLGELYDAEHDTAHAKLAYQKALEIDPNNPLACNNLAYLLLESGGDVDEAVSLAQTARRGTPDSPNAADTLGWAFYQKGLYQQSVDLFQEALRLAQKNHAPENPTVHFHLGLAYEKQQQPEQAKKELERVLQINPHYQNAADVKKALAGLHS